MVAVDKVPLTSLLTCDWLQCLVLSRDFPEALFLFESESVSPSAVFTSLSDSLEMFFDEVTLEQGVTCSRGLDGEFPATPPTLVPQGHAVHTLRHPLLERGGVFRNPEQQTGLSL